MYIAPLSLQVPKDFEFEDALLRKCYPRVLVSLGHSKNTQQSGSSCFATQSLYVDMPSYSHQKMLKPGADQLFLLAAPNTDIKIIPPRNN